MAKILITGIDGFIASHLAERVLNKYKNVEVVGTIRRMADRKNIIDFIDDMSLVDMELTDAHSVEKVIKEEQPDKVFHYSPPDITRETCRAVAMDCLLALTSTMTRPSSKER
mgnify:CR=1 FL=1